MKKGPKKTAEKMQVEQVKEQPTTRTFVTSDGQKFQLDSAHFSKYSNFVKYMDTDETLPLPGIRSDVFSCVIRFLENRKECQPREIASPLKINKDLSYIMEKCDAELIQGVLAEGFEKYEKLIVAANFLQIESLLKLLFAGVAMHLISKDIQVLKKQFGVADVTVEDQDAMKADLRTYLQQQRQI